MRLYESERWLRRQVLIERRTAEEIAAQCGVDERTIRNWIRKFNIR